MKTITIEGVKDFSPDHIFGCGQCFRWERQSDGSYEGIAKGNIARIYFEAQDPENPFGPGTLTIETTREEEHNGQTGELQKEQEVSFWRGYFDLDRDYGKIKKELISRDPVMGEAIKSGEGIRILDQEPWETVVSFIISSNNNIPRIKKCINCLAENFGQRAGTCRGKEYYSLPEPRVLAALTKEDLACCRLGYRAGYLIKTAVKIKEDGKEKLEDLRECSCEDCFSYIKNLSGVGPKVADCILLFSLRKKNRFPVDVWMRKVMHELYGFAEDDIKGMSDFAEETFGEYAGIAQQYLYYHMRKKDEKRKEKKSR